MGDGWFVFRRYTDFLRLNRRVSRRIRPRHPELCSVDDFWLYLKFCCCWCLQLKSAFPGLRLVLPPKKWFGDNFDPEFLEDRLLGLQAYVTNITNHPDISQQWVSCSIILVCFWPVSLMLFCPELGNGTLLVTILLLLNKYCFLRIFLYTDSVMNH